jgi:alkanesulfonate monooxygenase SsuD/methylene tetrahydromethanopterin reductase-like flavin-dependent oxidoreductase (luciferase family)
MQNLVAGMLQISPEEARAASMMGDRQECLDTVERYVAAGVTHFIFMLFAPYELDEVQAFAEEVIPAVRGRAA